MPKPFPLPISVGTDICSTTRIFSILTRNPTSASHFFRRVFGPRERRLIPWGKVREPIEKYWVLRSGETRVLTNKKEGEKGKEGEKKGGVLGGKEGNDGEEITLSKIHRAVFGRNGKMRGAQMVRRLIDVDLSDERVSKLEGGVREALQVLRGENEKEKRIGMGEKMIFGGAGEGEILGRMLVGKGKKERFEEKRKYWGERFEEAKRRGDEKGMEEACLGMWRAFPVRSWAELGVGGEGGKDEGAGTVTVRDGESEEVQAEEEDSPAGRINVDEGKEEAVMQDAGSGLEHTKNELIPGEEGNAEEGTTEVIIENGNVEDVHQENEGLSANEDIAEESTDTKTTFGNQNSGNAVEEGIISNVVSAEEEYLSPAATSGMKQDSGGVEESAITQEPNIEEDVKMLQEPADGEPTTSTDKTDEATTKETQAESTTQDLSTVIPQLKRSAEWLAGRYAAKEAAIKAHRSRKLTFHDIWIKSSAPINKRSVAPEALIISKDGSWENAQSVPMNISHDSDYATAVCLAHEVEGDEQTKNLDGGIVDRIQLLSLTNTAGEELGTALREQRKNDPDSESGEQDTAIKIRKAIGGSEPTIRANHKDVEKGKGASPLSVRRLGKISEYVRIVSVTPFQSEKISQMKRTLENEREMRQKAKQKVEELQAKLKEATGDITSVKDGKPVVRRTNEAPASTIAERARRTIFIGNLSPETTIKDLQEAFREFSPDTKSYLYMNESRELLGTGAVVMETSDEARTARLAKDNTMLRGRAIRCMPFFSTSYRKFLQRVMKRDAIWLPSTPKATTSAIESAAEVPAESETEETKTQPQPQPQPQPLLEREPLPEPTSPQYILVRELFRIQEEYYRNRGRNLYISNINRDATENDIQGLFEGFGKVEVRVRRRSTGESLGSASVVFESPAEAERAREQIDGDLFMGQEVRCKVWGEGRGRSGRGIRGGEGE